MNKLIVLLMTMMCSCVMFAQGTQTAILHHGDEFKSFYSEKALIEAMASAENGDVITLSPGQFTACDITKAVTIKGAGMEVPCQDSFTRPTILTGEFTISLPDSICGNHHLYMEGISHSEGGIMRVQDLSNATFSKCSFYQIRNKNLDRSSKSITENFANILFVHCIVNYGISASAVQSSEWGNLSLTFYNSVVTNPNVSNTPTKGVCSFYNSVIRSGFGSAQFYHTSRILYFENCIIVNLTPSTTSADMDKEHTIYNTMFTGSHAKNPFPGVNSTRNNYVMDNSPFVENTFYELTDEAKKCLGTDGKEIGIYGGTNPFTAKPAYPTIKKFSVSPESTTEGKLKIELEISPK